MFFETFLISKLVWDIEGLEGKLQNFVAKLFKGLGIEIIQLFGLIDKSVVEIT